VPHDPHDYRGGNQAGKVEEQFNHRAFHSMPCAKQTICLGRQLPRR
jgi:hypothetical protein